MSGDRPPEVPPTLPVLPLRETVVFPMAVVPVLVGRARSVELVERVMKAEKLVALVLQRDPTEAEPAPAGLHELGTMALVHQALRGPDGTLRLAVQGLERIRVREYVQADPYYVASVARAPERDADGVEAEALARSARDLFAQLVSMSTDLPDELGSAALQLEEPRHVVSLIAASAPFSASARQRLLELESVVDRLRQLIELLQHELAVRRVESDITAETRRNLSRTQREFVLREHMKTIQRELGEGEEDAEDLGELRVKLDEAGLPEEARREADRELERLQRMPSISMEHGIARSWLEWLAAMPWNRSTSAPLDVARAQQVLDEDHYDLQKVKERIVEYLAVRRLRTERRAKAGTAPPVEAAVDAGEQPAGPSTEDDTREPILCFIGPPGVGKTSLGHSIARAMGRRFVRISLGGVHDESEIRGHRRTYVGAMPGRIVQAIRRAGANDPVFMLDEVDKLGAGFHGDPAAALLELLDPAQNATFTDTYLGVAFDLRRVLFICTANTTDHIPAPLLDRMEVLALAGYTEQEKEHIARRYLVPKQLRAHGLEAGEFVLHDDALRRLVREYTREAGVRGLERELAALMRKAARRIGDGHAGAVELDAPAVADLLGPPRFFDELAERLSRPGVATGLAWTPAGGDVLFVEAAMMPSSEERLVLTGMLGDVMRESAQAALTWVRCNAPALGVDARDFERRVVHVHVPAGAIPKDGPSAGVTILAALASAVTGRLTAPGVAMTGEITLRGKVLPVGGVKEKVLAAHRAGIHTVVLPRRSEGQLRDVPAEVLSELRIVLADTAEDVLAEVLADRPEALDERRAGEPAHEGASPGPALH